LSLCFGGRLFSIFQKKIAIGYYTIHINPNGGSMNNPSALQELRKLLREVAYYAHLAGLLQWDKETSLPAAAGPGRDEVRAYVDTRYHDLLVSERIGELLLELQSPRGKVTLSSIGDRLVNWLWLLHARAKAMPSDLVRAWSEVTSRSQRHWLEARAKSDFSIFLPHLKEVLNLLRQRAQAFGIPEGGELYDALLPDFEPGMTTAELRRILLPLGDSLPPLIQAWSSHPRQPRIDFLSGNFPVERQLAFSRQIVGAIGFDYSRGSLTGVPGHPMTITLGGSDIRFTTRFVPDQIVPAIMASAHEAGHGLYCQGMDLDMFGWLPLESISMGIHESQSRMWENMVGRSLPFWEMFFPGLQAMFPEQFGGITAKQLWLAVNCVRPSPIRIYADEATYNLHILLRFKLELALLSGDLLPEDLPAAWNEGMEEYLGVQPKNDAEGCLQDIHFSAGYFGYFPTYALGNLLAGQLWIQINHDLPDLQAGFRQGEFQPLLEWLRPRVHRWGPIYTIGALAEEVTGQPLSAEAWLTYIQLKFSEIYH